METIHLAVNFLMFTFLLMIWDCKDWANLTLKISFFVLMAWAMFSLLVALGMW